MYDIDLETRGFCVFLCLFIVDRVTFCVSDAFSLVCFELLVPVQVIAWKDSSRNDLLCIEWGVKLYLLTQLPHPSNLTSHNLETLSVYLSLIKLNKTIISETAR